MSDRTPLLLKDGTILSVQASSEHNCSPRADNPDKGYGSVEIKISSNPNDFNNRDVEGWATPQRVLELIQEHGGVVGGQLPPLNFGEEMLVKLRLHKLADEADKIYKNEKQNEGEEE